MRIADAPLGTSSPRFLVRGGRFPPSLGAAELHYSAALRRTLARSLARVPATFNGMNL